jgi:hypothetical protein
LLISPQITPKDKTKSVNSLYLTCTTSVATVDACFNTPTPAPSVAPATAEPSSSAPPLAIATVVGIDGVLLVYLSYIYLQRALMDSLPVLVHTC